MLSQDLQQLHSDSQTQGPGGGQQAEEEVETLLAHFLGKGHLQGCRAAHPICFPCGFLLSASCQASQPNPQGTGSFPRLQPLLLVSDNVTVLLC